MKLLMQKTDYGIFFSSYSSKEIDCSCEKNIVTEMVIQLELAMYNDKTDFYPQRASVICAWKGTYMHL